MAAEEDYESEQQQPLLKPNVLWAQRKEMILLRIQMEPLEKPDFEVHETHLDFKGLGRCASGKNIYGFQLVFYEAIDTQHCRVRFFEHEVEFRLKKTTPGTWPRLQSQHSKPHWIKVDFDHFEVSDSEEEKEPENEEMAAEMKELEKKLMEDVKDYESMVATISNIKIWYLVLYNAIQCIGFTVLVGILLYLLKDGTAGIARAYELGFPVIAIFQSLACLEIVHNAFGLVKGGVVPSIVQVGGRLFVLFLCLSPVESIHSHPVVYCLFMIYALIEIVRYPFYVTSALNVSIGWLSWLRYSMWIPLYPLGFTCEATTIWLSLQYGPPGGVWSYPMPNLINMSISVAGIQKIVLATLPIFFVVLYSHMASQRKKRLSKDSRTVKPKKH